MVMSTPDNAPPGGKCTIAIMIDSASWRWASFGTEAFHWSRRDGALLAFGRGPREAASDRGRRAAEVLEALTPEVRAVRWCRQVHGVLAASLSDEPGEPQRGAAEVGRCDGLITAEDGLAVGVWTADCVPVLLAGGGVAAAVHSGWRGTAAGVVPRVVRRIAVEHGVSPDQLHAAIGPAVGRCHYQVGAEVVSALDDLGVDRRLWLEDDRVGLRPLIAAELEAVGVPRPRIETVGPCTACDERYASYRRDGEAAGRQLSFVVRLTDGP